MMAEEHYKPSSAPTARESFGHEKIRLPPDRTGGPCCIREYRVPPFTKNVKGGAPGFCSIPGLLAGDVLALFIQAVGDLLGQGDQVIRLVLEQAAQNYQLRAQHVAF